MSLSKRMSQPPVIQSWQTLDDAAFLDLAQLDPAYPAWLEGLQAGLHQASHHTVLVGPGLSHKAYLVAAAARDLNLTAPVVLVSDELQLRQWETALRPYAEVWAFRPRDLDLYGAEASSRQLEHQRLAVLSQWCCPQPQENDATEPDAASRPAIYLVAASALLQRLPDPRWVQACTLWITPQEAPDPEALEQALLAAGYEKRVTAEAAGQFARRGEIFDLVPVGFNPPYQSERGGQGIRLTYFDTELDAATCYALETQRSLEPLKQPVRVTPAREWVLPQDAAKRARWADDLLEAGRKSLLRLRQEGLDVTLAKQLETRLFKEATGIREGLSRAPLDKWLDQLFPGVYTGLDYLAQTSTLLFCDEPHRMQHQLDAAQADWANRVAEGQLKGKLFPAALKGQVDRPQVMGGLDERFSIACLAQIGISSSGFAKAQTYRLLSREGEGYKGREADFLARLKDDSQPPVILAYLQPQQKEAVQHRLVEEGIAPSRLRFLSLPLPHGFEQPKAKLWVLGIEDFFTASAKRKTKKRRKGLSLDLFSDLRPGDLVVHEIHGIARYQGLETVENEGVRRDYLKLEYAKGDSLFLPMDALDQIQKYIGASEQNPPKLSRLGGSEWTKLKARARDSVKKLATDLVKLYAQRRRKPGHAFSPNTTWDEAFAESFPYEETTDQLTCIEEVFHDMESAQVMDRLLCGDVGFGKTEVAFRALFKAVMGGKQAALLTPTTVLAQQHYENFLKRIEDFPLRVGLLSRFASEAHQKATLSGLKKGEIDVVIGTHRLLSKDVCFKDLGLLVIDEEQRFGVDHKEGLKARYPEVDVLALSATPIPRTLHMSLSGIRAISVLEDPPVNRRAVLTYVLEYDEGLIQEAMMREFSRGGQVFYLFNDTRKMSEKVAELQALLPGARILHAHGQMSEHRLEQVIEQFIGGQADLLVCTTIIESGIDMPNVNTLIVERADRLGLAQLYQLRGRVGRSGRQGYAYVTYRKDSVLTTQSEQRLAAIRDYTELGAGFKIALRDLEVRGAGNLLGGEQHGQMAAIGYDLYCRMLDEEIQAAQRAEGGEDKEDAVTADRGASFKPVETVIDWPLDAYLSADFIPDEGQRMDLYRRLTGIDSEAMRQDVIDELLDRFGELPLAVQDLADLSYIRHRAGALGIQAIALEPGGRVRMRLVAGQALPMQALSHLLGLSEYSGQVVFHAELRPWISYQAPQTEPRPVLRALRRLFARAEESEAAAG